MEHEFLRTIRAYIFYQRVQFSGMLVFQTVVWSQLLDLERYFPNFAHSAFHTILLVIAGIIGMSAQIYGGMKVVKPRMTTIIKSWSASLPETKRALHLAVLALGTAALELLGIVIFGIDDRHVVDYRSLILLVFISTMWIVYIAELIVPHTMELRKVTRNQGLDEGVTT